MFPYLRLVDVELEGRTVVLRVDFNSPVDTERRPPALRGSARIDDHLEATVIPLLERERPPRNLVLLAHQGRRGRPDFTTLRPHFEHVRKRLEPHRIETRYVWEDLDDAAVAALGEEAVASAEVLERIRRLPARGVLLLENVRFSASEDESSRTEHSALIQMLGEIEAREVALDGFSVAHRAQPSVSGLRALGRLCAGPVLVREIEKLARALERPEPPMMLVIGGAKIDDSLASIDRFLGDGVAEAVLTGGLVGLAFLRARGVELPAATVANVERASAAPERALARAADLLRRHGDRIRVPLDGAAAGPRGRRTLGLAELAAAPADVEIGDVGPVTIADYGSALERARTIVMNGPLGRFEDPALAAGTDEVLGRIARVARDRGARALVGGGDTGAALARLDPDLAGAIEECTSGKAFLEVLSSGDVGALPGIRALARAPEGA